MRKSALYFCLACILTLAACTKQSIEPTFFADSNPYKLSDWNMVFLSDGTLQSHSATKVFSLNTSLFSDYAHKLRTIWIPISSRGKYINGEMDFPVGTVISKTFYYPKNNSESVLLIEQFNQELNSINLDFYQLIETRLLVKRESGWVGLPYVWNKEQTEATLQRFGEVLELSGVNKKNKTHSFTYLVPDVNQCAACHQWDMNKGMQPIGLQARHLNLNNKFEKYLTEIEPVYVLNAKARSYLDINCSHCHSPIGPANTSGLHLETYRPLSTQVGLCKLPIAAGKGTGGRRVDIDPGHAENSIFTYRIESTDPASMMPELGRSLVHEEGLELVSSWIAGLDYSCINTDSKLE